MSHYVNQKASRLNNDNHTFANISSFVSRESRNQLKKTDVWSQGKQANMEVYQKSSSPTEKKIFFSKFIIIAIP